MVVGVKLLLRLAVAKRRGALERPKPRSATHRRMAFLFVRAGIQIQDFITKLSPLSPGIARRLSEPEVLLGCSFRASVRATATASVRNRTVLPERVKRN